VLARYEVDPIKPAEAEKELRAAIQKEASVVVNTVIEEFNRKMTAADLAGSFTVNVAKKQEYGTMYPLTTNPRVLECALASIREKLREVGWECSVELRRSRVAWFWSYVDYDRPAFVFGGVS